MIFARALGESDLHTIYRGHYRHSEAAGSRNVQHSHTLENNVDGSGLTGDRSTYRAVSSKLLSHVDNLVGYWALDGDATDSSGNGLDGAVPNPEYVPGVCAYTRNPPLLVVSLSFLTGRLWLQTDLPLRSTATMAWRCQCRQST